MTTPAPDLQLPEGAALDLAAMTNALATRFDVTTGPRELLRRTRLDTFDRRLASAGLILEHQTTGSSERLVLRGPGTRGGQVVAPTEPIRWPALADALPPGPVREAVAPVTGIRALVSVTDDRRRVRRLELRNGDQKLVARVEADEPAGAGSTSPASVTVQPLRGYDDQGRWAVRSLTAIGLRPVEPVDAQLVPHPAPAVDLDRGTPAPVLLAVELEDFLAAIRENLPGLLDDIDTEFLHDVRVAVRRTRSTLKLGRPALPSEMRDRWEPAFKWLGDLTTPVRDLDVYQLGLPAMAGWLVAADPADLEPFRTHLGRRRRAERRALVRGLKSARFERLLTDWQQALAELGAGPHSDDDLQAGELADRSISRAVRRAVRGGRDIDGASPAESLHTLRKRCKELRYALEVFAPVTDKADRKQAVADLKVLQDVLGRFQDAEVQRVALRGFAAEMMADGTSAQAVLAMGELVGHLDGEQDRARQEFDSVFARFVRPASMRRLRRLGGA